MNTPLSDIDLILASTSTYRRQLLARLGVAARQAAPQVDETACSRANCRRSSPTSLPAAKAHALAAANPGALIIGSDQVADCAGKTLGKPGDAGNARAQLRASSGRVVTFHTAVCLIDTRFEPLQRAIEREFRAIDTTRVAFRTLGDEEIARYRRSRATVRLRGQLQVREGLGISLFERIDSKDPTALIGLPLVALCRLLHGEAGIDPVLNRRQLNRDDFADWRELCVPLLTCLSRGNPVRRRLDFNSEELSCAMSRANDIHDMAISLAASSDKNALLDDRRC